MTEDRMNELVRRLPELIRPWTAPFHVTMDGIKDARGCWICSASNHALSVQLVELMNFAAEAASFIEHSAKERRVRHKKRGSEYSVLGEGRIQCNYSLADLALVTIYRGDDGQFWVRPTIEFEDGRFEELSEHSAKEVGAVSDEMVERAIENVSYLCGRWEKNQGASSLTIAAEASLGTLDKALSQRVERLSAAPIESAPAAGVKALPEGWQLVWVQNLIGFLSGAFPADERWKKIFIEQLAALATPSSPDVELQTEVERLTSELWPNNNFGPKTLDEIITFVKEERKADTEYLEGVKAAREAAEARALSAVKALEEEREACAQIAHEWDGDAAAAIRARTTLQSTRG